MTTMRLDLGQNLRLDQKMILAPRMIQSMEILQLPIMALQERIQQELQENPVLELKEGTEEEDAETLEAEAPAAESEPADETDAEFERLEALARDWDDQFVEGHRPSRNGME